jgi:hypothetical protein
VAVAVLVLVGVIVREGVNVGTALAGCMGAPGGSVGEAVGLWGREQAASNKMTQDTGNRFFISEISSLIYSPGYGSSGNTAESTLLGSAWRGKVRMG